MLERLAVAKIGSICLSIEFVMFFFMSFLFTFVLDLTVELPSLTRISDEVPESPTVRTCENYFLT